MIIREFLRVRGGLTAGALHLLGFFAHGAEPLQITLATLMGESSHESFNNTLVQNKMPPEYVKPVDMSTWAECVGGLILNFGIAEFQTVRWIDLLAGADTVVALRTKMLGPRITAAKDLIDSSAIPDDQKSLAHDLWDELKELTRIRNRIAHNPLVLGRDAESGEFTWSIIDLKLVVPIGENRLERLDCIEIQRVALRVGDISFALSAIIDSAPV